jgi:NDP-sugar pyrophosphorylase family protein
MYMKYAIIAAGEGSRLLNDGITTPKPVIRINGERMIDRLIRIFSANNASSISIIVNEEMHEVHEHLIHTKYPVQLFIIRKNTPSSMHSFYELSHTLRNDRFCLATVDTIFREDEFSEYITAFQRCEDDGLFAVTGYVDDEKPLYVETDKNGLIHDFKDDDFPDSQYVSGGIYCLKNNSIEVLKNAIENGMFRMRNYQRQLLKNRFILKAFPFSKIIDVDRQNDIHKAEMFLKAIDYQP